MKIALGADPSGYELKESIKQFLLDNGHEVTDFGTSDMEKPIQYIEAADKVAKAVQNKSVERGILVCSTGMGVSIIANKHKGVYAACVESQWAAHEARTINNANVLTLGGRIYGTSLALDVVSTFLNTGWLEGLPADLAGFVKALGAQVSEFEETAF